MIALHVTEKDILLATVEKKSFGSKPAIRIIGKVERNTESLTQQLLEIIEDNSEVAFTVSDYQVYLYRFEVPAYITQEALTATILDKAREVIPTPIDELLYDFAVLGKTAESHIVLFAATPRKSLTAYFDACDQKGSKASFIIPDTVTIFSAIKHIISENDLILYIEENEKDSKIAFYDTYGPFLTIAEPLPTSSLEKEIANALKVVRERYGREVTKIIFSGEKSKTHDPFKFKKIIDVETVSINKILEKIIEEHGVEIGFSKQEYAYFLQIIGLSLLISGNQLINLAGKDDDERVQYVPSQLTVSTAKENLYTPPADGNDSNFEPDNSHPSSFPFKKAAIGLFIFAVIVLAGFILWKFRPYASTKKKTAVNITASVTRSATTPSPSASPTPEIAKDKVIVKVLNGSGTKGEAGSVAKILKDTGFSQTSTGNADNFNYSGVKILSDNKAKIFVAQIKQALAAKYSDITTGDIDKAATEDIQIILGK